MESQVSRAEPPLIDNDTIVSPKTAVASEVTTATRGKPEGSTRLLRPTTLSALERLPLELLQYIFLESMNINLPRASPALCSALSSRHIKIKLVLSVFAMYRHHNDQWITAMDSPGGANADQYLRGTQHRCSSRDWYTYADRPRSCWKFSSLQRRILRLRWLTMDFMKECMNVFLSQTMLSVLGENSVWAVVESQDGLTGVRSNTVIANSILRGVDLKLERSSSQNARRRALCIAPSNGVVVVEELDPLPAVDGAKLDILEIGAPYNARYLDEGSHGELPRSETWALPSFENRCQIPQRLLHGPWTDEKSEYLEFLLRKGLELNDILTFVPSNREVAERGLVDAIREGNMRAVKNLVSVCILDWSANPYEEEATDNTGRDYSLPRDPDTNRPITKLARETPPLHSVCRRPHVGVVPQTHHLRVAVLEKNCSKHIVSWLYIAGYSKIDWNDDQVMDWAARKDAEGEEIGAWLLGLRKGDAVERRP